jgi:hypothetical protein
MEDSAGSRRSCRPRCPAGPAELPLSESNRRTAAFRRWRHCVDDLGCPAFAVPVADLGDRGHVRSVVRGAPCSRGACRRSCSRRGRPRPAGAAEGGEAVSGDGSGHAGDITDHVAAVFLPLEHRSAFPTCAVQRAFGHSNRLLHKEIADSQVDSQHPAPGRYPRARGCTRSAGRGR